MRIVGGKWRGKPVEAPKGKSVTRPTTDRMRESIASMILSAEGLDLSGKGVLDAFAGSGAMGLELVSRGAARCTFVDSDHAAASRIVRTASSLGAMRGECEVVAGDVFRRADRGTIPGAPFAVVFLDPPYATDATLVSGLVDSLWGRGLLVPGALVVYERSDKAAPLSCAHAVPLRSKGHGITSVDLLRAEGGNE